LYSWIFAIYEVNIWWFPLDYVSEQQRLVEHIDVPNSQAIWGNHQHDGRRYNVPLINYPLHLMRQFLYFQYMQSIHHIIPGDHASSLANSRLRLSTSHTRQPPQAWWLEIQCPSYKLSSLSNETTPLLPISMHAIYTSYNTRKSCLLLS
jgi:hypothetical protein